MKEENFISDSQIAVSLTVGQLRGLIKEVLEEGHIMEVERPKNYVYGLRGIQSLLNCSHTQAQRYKDTVLKDAVMQNGRKIVVDADKALELFNNRKNNCFFLYTTQTTTNLCFFAHSEQESEAEGLQAENLNEEEQPIFIGMLKIQRINNALAEARNIPEPRDLFRGIWNEGEMACLFSDSNVGKSILALQIGEQIASTQQPVLYCDFEMSDSQLEKRYSENTSTHVFSSDFYRCTINPYNMRGGDFESNLLTDIEAAAQKLCVKIVIIDNLTYMCSDAEKGDSAGILMRKLMMLKHKYGWSLLVIAHTPKRDEKSPILSTHLAGSKKIFNFFDSIFALGRSSKGPSYRYLKQLKVRSGEIQYGEDNVLVLQMVKATDGNLYYVFHDTETEEVQLSYPQTRNYSPEVIERVIQLRSEGNSFRDIEDTLDGVSRSTAQRIWTEYTSRQEDSTNQGAN